MEISGYTLFVILRASEAHKKWGGLNKVIKWGGLNKVIKWGGVGSNFCQNRTNVGISRLGVNLKTADSG